MRKQNIQTLKEGDLIAEDYKILSIQDQVTKNGKPYKRFSIGDRSGELPAVFFDSQTCPFVYKSGDVCHVTGVIDSYNGKAQIKVQSVGPRHEQDGESEFTKCSAYDPEAMWMKLLGYVTSIDDNQIRTVADNIFCHQGYENQFKTSPAATGMHHAFRNGLLEHTVQMAECADTLLKLPFFTPLNRDLCMFGILFHDFGKIFEYSSDAGFKKTVQGVLVPHIPMMGALIFETANKYGVPEIIRDHLMHVVLAHHMQLDWGSPVVPACPEAAFVHYVDNLHGTVFGWLQRREAKKGEELIENWSNGKCALLGKSFNEILRSLPKEEEGF